MGKRAKWLVGRRCWSLCRCGSRGRLPSCWPLKSSWKIAGWQCWSWERQVAAVELEDNFKQLSDHVVEFEHADGSTGYFKVRHCGRRHGAYLASSGC